MAAVESHNPIMGELTYDVEKQPSSEESLPAKSIPLWFRILNWGVEEGGIEPVPLEKRTDTRFVNLFTVWFTALLCLLP